MEKLTHFDSRGQAIMVDVSEKQDTSRVAVATGYIYVNEAVYKAIEEGTAAKGDVLGVARIAGIMAAKKTSDVIPLCHPLPLAKCNIDFELLSKGGKGKGNCQGDRKNWCRDGSTSCSDSLPAHYL